MASTKNQVGETTENQLHGLNDLFKDEIDEKYNSTYDNNNDISRVQEKMHRLISTDYTDIAPHVNGYYYIHMVPGTWKDHMLNQSNHFENDIKTSNEFSSFDVNHFNIVEQRFGQFATDIDIPQVNLEYESISGKSRNLNYVSKQNFNGDFSINFLEEADNLIFRYHENWFKYIEALKKGYIKNAGSSKGDFIDVPYFNAVWVAVFAPFSTDIRCLIKILGVSPINLPFKQIIGDRSKSTLTTINQNYKSNDMVYKFYDKDEINSDDSNVQDNGLWKDFMQDIQTITQ